MLGILGFNRMGVSLSNLWGKKSRIIFSGETSNIYQYSHRLSDNSFIHASPSCVVRESTLVIITDDKPIEICQEISNHISKEIPVIVTSPVLISNLYKYLPNETIIACSPNIGCVNGNTVVPYFSYDDRAHYYMEQIFSPNLISPLNFEEQIVSASFINQFSPSIIAKLISILKRSVPDLDENNFNKLCKSSLIALSDYLVKEPIDGINNLIIEDNSFLTSRMNGIFSKNDNVTNEIKNLVEDFHRNYFHD